MPEYQGTSPTVAAEAALGALPPDAPDGEGGRAPKKLGLLFWLSAGWLGLVVFGAVFAGLLPLQSTVAPDPCSTIATTMSNSGVNELAARLYTSAQSDSPDQAVQDAKQGMKPPASSYTQCKSATLDSKVSAFPSARHWLGTDANGRDTLARIVYGAQVALLVGVVSIAIGMIIGGTVGMIAGYFRGTTEGLIMTIVDVALAYPALVLAIAIVAFRGQSLFNVCLAISIVSIPAFARIARGATLTYAEREFVTAARVTGATHRRIIFKEILPNVVLPVVAFALLAVAIAIVAEGGLAFLGLSVPPPRPSWGSMI